MTDALVLGAMLLACLGQGLYYIVGIWRESKRKYRFVRPSPSTPEYGETDSVIINNLVGWHTHVEH